MLHHTQCYYWSVLANMLLFDYACIPSQLLAVPSEDPHHAGEFGRYFVRGMAGGEGPWHPAKGRYLKVSGLQV
jgi:hypothetical protein